MTPAVILIMGVSGSGKTTLGRALAKRLACRFVDADDLHPPANREKMARGEPLDDHDRLPWLDAIRREIQHALQREDASGVDLVITCSALKRSYRDHLRHADEPVTLVHLGADRSTLMGRLSSRRDHFFPADLLDSQLDTLEPPTEDENVLELYASQPLDKLVDAILRQLTASPPHRTPTHPRRR
ncbi:MAG: gluconokinase [Phycisphaeraceae bacterium]